MTECNEQTWRLLRNAALGLFFFFTSIVAGTTLWRLGHWALTDGPNTVGEAGKVYYAARFAAGKTIFVTADAPPHYASMHGALLHATVGLMARIGDLSVRGMYLAGRAISIVGTVIALMCACAILRRWGASWLACVAALLLFFASEAITQHAVSYRADHWNLALAAIACWLLMAHPGKRWRLPILAAIPAVAFFIKAPGAALAISILLGLGAERRWKQGVATGIASLALLGAALGILVLAAEGPVIGAMRSGLAVPMSAGYLQALVSERQHWLIWLLGIWLAMRARPFTAVNGFFIIAFLSAAISAMRAGGGAYYFVEATLWAIVLCVAWGEANLRHRRFAPAALALLFAALWIAPWRQVGPASFPITDNTPMDNAVRINRDVAMDREATARFINDQRLFCYSNDAGLNILLDHPAVIEPVLAAIADGDTVSPVRRREYDVLVLSRFNGQYLGKPVLSEAFVAAMREHYVQQKSNTNYLMLYREAVSGGGASGG